MIFFPEDPALFFVPFFPVYIAGLLPRQVIVERLGVPGGRGQKKRTTRDESSALLSGYCDSNTGPSGPKPDALANCATPR